MCISTTTFSVHFNYHFLRAFQLPLSSCISTTTFSVHFNYHFLRAFQLPLSSCISTTTFSVHFNYHFLRAFQLPLSPCISTTTFSNTVVYSGCSTYIHTFIFLKSFRTDHVIEGYLITFLAVHKVIV